MELLNTPGSETSASAASRGYTSLVQIGESVAPGVERAERSGRSYYNEHDRNAAEWLRQLIAEGVIAPGDVDERSITEIDPDELTGYTQLHFFAGIGGWSYALRLAGWPDEMPVWTGSCPCQPFSAAGQGKVDKDERHLWPAFRAAIAKRRPAIVFGEQVASADGRVWLAGVRADVEAMGYVLGAADLCAASVGAPHRRQRIFWVAYADGWKPGDGELQRSGQHGQWAQNGLAGGLGDAASGGRGERGNEALAGRGGHALGASWAGYEVLKCRDGKARRVEAGTFPLGDGIPGRMGLLRGYGNAIVPQVAAEFVSACLEVVRLGGGGGVLVGRCAPTTEAKCNSKLTEQRSGL
jgi:DNA (cytosine-5)-methyltransferase 1